MAKRAALSVVRTDGTPHEQGNPPILPAPSVPDMPKWTRWFPAVGHGSEMAERDSKQCRATARMAWMRWSHELFKMGVLSVMHADVLADAAVCVARIEQCERDISRYGVQYPSDRQNVRVMNRAITAAGQYRSSLRTYIRLLGLAPGATLRSRSNDPDEDGIWDG